jgi:hypothetical protein
MWWMAGCYFEVDGYDGPRAPAAPEDYDTRVAELEEHRELFGGEEIGEMWAEGERLYWLEYRAWDPTLHGLSVDYAVQLSFERLSLALGEQAFATAELRGGQVLYRVFAADAPDEVLTELVLPDWWPYAVDGETLYVAERSAVSRVEPGGEPEPAFVLEGDELWGFGVDGDTVVWVEGGRLWALDLASGQARWAGNEHLVQGEVQFDSRGVLFLSDRPWYWSLQDDTVTDLAAALSALPTPAGLPEGAHHFEQDITRWGDHFVYGGTSGIFLYDPAHPEVTPVLLEPRTALRVDYRYPVVTDSGSLYVTALESESGAVGADGPVYRVDLAR